MREEVGETPLVAPRRLSSGNDAQCQWSVLQAGVALEIYKSFKFLRHMIYMIYSRTMVVVDLIDIKFKI